MAAINGGFKVAMVVVIIFVGGTANAQLSSNFYSSSCPNLFTIIKTAVDSAVASDPRMGASLLRLHFHDCFVGGCDGSVLLDDTANFTGEKTARPNANSLRGFDVIDTIKASVERSCPGVVSCADILAVAGRDGVVALRGPSWRVTLGRRDSTTASLSAANSQIPAPTLNLSALITSFSNKGFNTRELVALSGSHSIGQARCTTFRTRIYTETNINAAFATAARGQCPQSGGDNNLSPLDNLSPNVFNNDYFTNLVGLRGLLHSDQQLFNNVSTDAQVRAYAANSASFFNDFASAMVKMSNLAPLTGTSGQIRTNCRRVN
ncbi:cationic peroxidase 1-like [Andrographis paniculata]|uniref:cationic peroxidase 1-like n=1 Tax=Andrographis paniculata TaxID=175694 RepID=UPI0021E80B7D|nr:cationic peroxidase 1-like [Andrographis paniculata]